ncbi:MAG TPA: hypothetical protein ENG70_06085 [Candidatus Cloacimonetes bacterium]|nr:hypothetical protein [Candidatus Cloacimonadota bacterium]HEX38401.1 hypothetical protein [Candidatus Cloacimonadota bacterium]
MPTSSYGRSKKNLILPIFSVQYTSCRKVYPLDNRIESAFQESDVLVVELDATTLDQNVLNTFIAQYALYPNSTNLELELPRRTLFKHCRKIY